MAWGTTCSYKAAFVEQVALSAEHEECPEKRESDSQSRPNLEQLERSTGWQITAWILVCMRFSDTPHTINTTKSPSVPAAGQGHKV